MHAARLSLFVVAALVLSACPAPKTPPVAAVDAGQKVAVGDTAPREGVKANFDASTHPLPHAYTLCSALYDVPAQKRATCCKFPAAESPLTKTCAGVLSSAIALKAVSLDDQKAEACITARSQSLEGCGWVGALTPVAPTACDDVLSGTADDGAACRSSLECKPGLRCHGAGPLDLGRCGRPLPDGSRCGAAVDGLSVVVTQAAIDRVHPECAGVCALGKCLAFRKAGDACMSELECGPGNRCDNGVCMAGKIALGAACTKGGCVDGTRCMDKKCRALKKEGESCSVDFDCLRGGCVKKKIANKGVCGMRCNPL